MKQNQLDPAVIANIVNNPPQPCDRIRRISNVPIPVIMQALTDQKQKCGGRNRRVLKAGMEYILLRPQTAPIDPAVKIALKLERLTIYQLIRRLKQSARRAATAKYLLAKMSPDSKFRPGILAEQTHQLGIMKQVQAELQVRAESKSTQ